MSQGESHGLTMKRSLYNRSVELSLRNILKDDLVIWLPGAFIVFLFASVLMSGWPDGLIPNIKYPFVDQRDGLFSAWVIQRLIEGSWIFENARSGYPFGSRFLDFPIPDTGSLIILKILGKLFGSYYAALNVYYLLGFSVTFITSFVVLRSLGVSQTRSVAGSVIYVFIPFHFLRLGHLFYSWYGVVPLFFFYGHKLFFNTRVVASIAGSKSLIFHAIILLVLGSFGVYYAFFGVLVLLVSGLAGSLRSHTGSALIAGLALSSVVTIALVVNIAPSLYDRISGVPNTEVATRQPMETEIYGLKLTQMILPRSDHRIQKLRDIASSYHASFPLTNENSKSALGLVGAVGLLCLLAGAFRVLSGGKPDSRLLFFATITLVLFMFATIGGLASIFALLVSPLIRGWNRVSVFIGFASVAAVVIWIDLFCEKYLSSSIIKRVWAVVISISIVIFAVWEQSSPFCPTCIEEVRTGFKDDKDFVMGIERVLPPGSAIYQLPYMPFPETPPLHQLGTYEHMKGFLHSQTLRWSYGGMRGRAGDLFFRALAQEPMASQIDVIRRLGFSGIYVDRRGFLDGGQAVEDEIRAALMVRPLSMSEGGDQAFYQLENAAPILESNLPSSQIMRQAHYFADKYGTRYQASLNQGIDFTKPGLPRIVKEVKGLSAEEAWGRWSDGLLHDSVVIEFVEPLPASFTLVLRATPFGPNIGKPVEVRVGSFMRSLVFSAGIQDHRFEIENDEGANNIAITPPIPTSPISLSNASVDTRMLGVRFESIRIEQ